MIMCGAKLLLSKGGLHWQIRLRRGAAWDSEWTIARLNQKQSAGELVQAGKWSL